MVEETEALVDLVAQVVAQRCCQVEKVPPQVVKALVVKAQVMPVVPVPVPVPCASAASTTKRVI